MAATHGRDGDPAWPAPALIAASSLLARPDQAAANKHDASEFLGTVASATAGPTRARDRNADSEPVLAAKIELLASMMRQSTHTLVYSGAGLSRAAGIPDYASRALGSVMAGSGRLANPLDAQPTLAHACVAGLVARGLVAAIVNQNHDGTRARVLRATDPARFAGLFEKAGVLPDVARFN